MFQVSVGNLKLFMVAEDSSLFLVFEVVVFDWYEQRRTKWTGLQPHDPLKKFQVRAEVESQIYSIRVSLSTKNQNYNSASEFNLATQHQSYYSAVSTRVRTDYPNFSPRREFSINIHIQLNIRPSPQLSRVRRATWEYSMI